jgi:uncharacterized membrane protein
MMNVGLLLLAIAATSSLFIVGVTPTGYAQTTVVVEETTPCFMNYTASSEMWENCGFKDNFIKATLMPFEWVMGGYFTLVIVSLIVIITYVKYQNAIYPFAISALMLPVAYYAFPDQVLGFVGLAGAVGAGGIIKEILFKQTKD